jgi:Raf kinase inhibitor-like YbhB/YbcL family protein
MKRMFLLAALSIGMGGVAGAMELKSADIGADGHLKAAQVYAGFGCSGGNLSPELSWANAPADTKSFAVTIYDPDAPTGSGWWHWVVYDIPASVNHMPAGIGKQAKSVLPGGARVARNDFGTADFGGACPPAGDKPHRYIITVFALKAAKLEVPNDASPAMVGFNLNAATLAKASLTASYGR